MKKTKLPNLISVLFLTLITVVMWVSFEIYRAVSKSPESVVAQEVVQALTPTLDLDVIKQIESRTLLDDSQIPEKIINSSPAPSVKSIPAPTTLPTIGSTNQPLGASVSGITQ